MEKKITVTNILSYLEGNTQRILEELNLQPRHLQEQIAYRRLLCKDDCAKTKKCRYCGCAFLGITSVAKSCNNGERFPDLMSGPEWEEFKKNL